MASIDNASHRTPKVGFRTAGTTENGWHVACGYVNADAEIGPVAPTWFRVTTGTDEFTPPHGFADDLPMSEAEPVDDLGDADDPDMPDVDAAFELVRLAIDRLPGDIVIPDGEPDGECAQIDLELAAEMLEDELTTARTVIDGDDVGHHCAGRTADRQRASTFRSVPATFTTRSRSPLLSTSHSWKRSRATSADRTSPPQRIFFIALQSSQDHETQVY